MYIYKPQLLCLYLFTLIIKMLIVVLTTTVVVLGIRKVEVVADDHCSSYKFKYPFYPGKSCEDIYNKNPEAHDISGYYWITDGLSNVYCGMSYTGLSCEHIFKYNRETGNKNGYYPINNNQWTFCNMTAIAASYFTFPCGDTGVGGEWRRIASFNINAGDDCPKGWNKSYHSDVSFCRSPSNTRGCYSVDFSSNFTSYQRVCGRARGYQKGTTDAFKTEKTINNIYVDGLSITHGSPHQHIWTYAAGLAEHVSTNYMKNKCPCTASPGAAPPSFVGSNYYCESGAENSTNISAYYLSDPLWDGSGCSSSNTCCSDINLPWFQYLLNQTTEDGIEVRICANSDYSNEGILIDFLELYIQ